MRDNKYIMQRKRYIYEDYNIDDYNSVNNYDKFI